MLEDVSNKQISIENYLHKYLPYNNFVSYMEVMHVLTDALGMKKLREYEKLKLKAFYLQMLADDGVAQNLNLTEIKEPPPNGKLTVKDYLHMEIKQSSQM